MDAALAEPMSTLGLAGLTQDQPAGLAAVLGFRGLYEVVPEAPVERQEACGGTCRETPPVSYLDNAEAELTWTEDGGRETFPQPWEVEASAGGQGLLER